MSAASTGVQSRYDAIVIGAGINGVGIARDAALRGLRVLLVDKGDVASGTTSWSSRLIHGGLRYLEHGEFGLVRESLKERERLLRNAPHLVQPLPLLIPIFRGDRRGPLLIRVGMEAYDALSIGKSLPRHRMLDRNDVMRRDPGILAGGLRGAALYYDAQVEYAERLAVENALDARVHGAHLRTYHEVTRIRQQHGRVNGIEGTDLLTGEPFASEAPVVVNVAGPWVDVVLDGSKADHHRLIGGTKGTHIIVPEFDGAPRDALYAEAQRDGRQFFVIPWNNAYLIGTTDTRYTGDLDYVVADDWEIEWLLQETNRVIPDAGLTQDHVLFSYAGVRPLPHSPGEREGSVTRRHHVVDHAASGGPAGLFSVVGGKLTTYRALAEHAVDLVMDALGRPRGLCQTAVLPLPGGRTAEPWTVFRTTFTRESGLPSASSEHLLRVYGARAPEVLARANTPVLREVFDPESGAIAAEIPWAFEEEGARTLADVVARRTMTGLGRLAGVGADAAAARIAQETLGWDESRSLAELERYREWVSRYRPRALAPANSARG